MYRALPPCLLHSSKVWYFRHKGCFTFSVYGIINSTVLCCCLFDQRFPNCGALPRGWGALLVLWGGASFCTRNIFILNEIRAKDKIYISVGTLLG
jgi:hypothetical protein